MKKYIAVLAVLIAVMVSVSAVAATVDLTSGSTAVRMAGSPTPVVLSKTINFATAGAVTGDVVRAIYLPAGTKVDEVFYQITATNGVSTTVNIGDTANAADHWASALNLHTTVTSGAVNSASNTLYTAADYVIVTLTGPTPTLGKLVIKVKATLYGETVPDQPYVAP